MNASKICTCTYFLINALQCWLTYDIKMRCSLKRRTFEMFGHGFIIVNPQVVASVDESSQSPFFCFSKRSINSDLQRSNVLSDLGLSNYPPVLLCLTSCPSSLCYLCLLSPQLGNNKCWTTTRWNHIYLLKRKCLFLYILMRTSTPPTTKPTTKGMYEVTDSAYLAYGSIFLGLELRYMHKVVYLVLSWT